MIFILFYFSQAIYFHVGKGKESCGKRLLPWIVKKLVQSSILKRSCVMREFFHREKNILISMQ